MAMAIFKNLQVYACTILSILVVGCGGGSGGGSTATPTTPPTTNTPPPPPPPPVTTYTVNADAGEGTTITPSSVVVDAGKTAVFTVSLISGYSNLVVTGAGGTLEGSVYTTGPINANATVKSRATSDKYSLFDIKVKPNALFDNEISDTPILVEATAQGKEFSLFLTIFRYGKNDEVPLLDNGEGGDRVAGDSVYSAKFTTGFKPSLPYYGGTVGMVRMWITARGADNDVLTSMKTLSPVFDIAVVSSALAVSTTEVGPGVVATANMVNVVLPNIANSTNWRDEAMKKVYEYFPDVFDAGIIHKIGYVNEENIANAMVLSNDASGINVGTSVSNRKLSIIVNQAADITGMVILHEVGHRWGFYLNKPELNLTDAGIHVRSPSTSIGQLGSYVTLKERADGDFEVVGPPDGGQYQVRKYSDLELYLMGMIPPASVGPERFALGPERYNEGDIVPRGKTTVVSIEDIVRVYGERLPSSANSQKAFRWVFVGLSERNMTAAEFAIISRLATYYASHDEGGEVVKDHDGITTRTPPSFWSATRYQGSVTTELPSKK